MLLSARGYILERHIVRKDVGKYVFNRENEWEYFIEKSSRTVFLEHLLINSQIETSSWCFAHVSDILYNFVKIKEFLKLFLTVATT